MNLIQTSEGILQQLKELLQTLTKEQYCSTLDVFSGASIGQHTRHILEFYEALATFETTVCYDERNRDKRLEEDTAFAIKFIGSLKSTIHNLDMDKEVVHVAGFGKEQNYIANEVKSSIGREMIYAVEHAVHHMAIIKIGLITNWPTIKIAQNFGVADSTVRYKEKCAH